MCGIVGYTGHSVAAPFLLQGLYKLEYRGYDSAGVALVENNGLRVIKTVGRISVLDEKLSGSDLPDCNCGIGHTRWATHGAPSDINAHPHQSQNGRFAIVHNGIIENYSEIIDWLKQKGYTLRSQTDSEVVAHLLEHFYNGDVLTAIRQTIAMLRGSYALGIVSAEAPGQIFCARKDSPLIIGLGKGENILASDIPAIMAVTKNYILLDDGDIACITPSEVTVYNKEDKPSEKQTMTVTWDVESAEKGGYDHFMVKEIYDQPKAVRDTVNPRIKNGLPVLEGIDPTVFDHVGCIHIVACGSAYHAGLVGKNALEKLARIPCTAQVASEFRYNDPIIKENDLCIIVSQSGETADTLAAEREAKRRGAKTLAIVNVVASSAAREADMPLYTWAGPEIAVATTKGYSTQCVAFYLIAIAAALARKTISEEEGRRLCAELSALPNKIKQSMGTVRQIEALADFYAKRDHCFFLGRGIDYIASLEASLKLKEISYIHSEAYAGGELKHGTIALIEPKTLVVALATDADLFEKLVSNIKSCKARGAEVILITNRAEEVGKDVCDHIVKIPETDKLLSASLSIVPVQLMAYYIARNRGCDIDKPRNLAKSVTVE